MTITASMTDQVAGVIDHNGSVTFKALEGLIDADPLVINAALFRLEETGTAVKFFTESYDGRQIANWRMA